MPCRADNSLDGAVHATLTDPLLSVHTQTDRQYSQCPSPSTVGSCTARTCRVVSCPHIHWFMSVSVRQGRKERQTIDCWKDRQSCMSCDVMSCIASHPLPSHLHTRPMPCHACRSLLAHTYPSIHPSIHGMASNGLAFSSLPPSLTLSVCLSVSPSF